MTKISGVYKITNTITGDFYIGSSNNVKRRWTQHKSPPRWKSKPGMKLYQAMAKYGLDNFTFEVLEETGNLKEREQYYIEQLNPNYNSNWAKGWDFERYKEYRDYNKESIRKSVRKSMKRYYDQLCSYNGKTITLNALSQRFLKQGIPHPTLEAKKYLLQDN